MSTWLWVLASTCGWFLLYAACGWRTRQRSPEWHSRMTTFVHATVVVALSTWSLFVEGPWPFTDPGGPNTPLHNVTMILCLSYFIFDFLWCLYHKTEGPFMIFHHILSITGNVLSLHYNLYGTELVATIFGTEITNPFLQLRWFLRKTGLGSRWYAEINDLFFMLLFGAMRIVVGGYLLYCYLNHPRPDWLGRAGGISIYLVGWVFWVMIVQYAVKKYSKMWKDYMLKERNSSKARIFDRKENLGNLNGYSKELSDSNGSTQSESDGLLHRTQPVVNGNHL